jgi:hypothetical protein
MKYEKDLYNARNNKAEYLRMSRRCVLVLAAIAIIGCGETGAPEQKPEGENPPPLVTMDELFVAEGEEGGLAKTVFRTNDVKYWRHEGATLWSVWGSGEKEFSSRTVKAAKTSGHSGGGYGVVFCQGEYEVGGKPTPAMLVVMINNNGQYIVGKVVGGEFTDFGWWKTSPYISTSAGFLNEISVEYNAEDKEYSLKINGNEVEQFSDDEYPTLHGGKNGYIAVITPYDNFPSSFVNVYYLEAR